MDTNLKIEGEVRKLRIEEGDVIVITLKDRVSVEAINQIKEYIEREFKGHKCLVLDNGTSLNVYSTRRSEEE